MTVRFTSFIGWKGSNFDGTGHLVAVFKKVTPDKIDTPNPSPAQIKLSQEAIYNKASLDAVLANPDATWSPEDRALLQRAQASYLKNNSGRG